MDFYGDRSMDGQFKRLYVEGNWMVVEDLYTNSPFKLCVYKNGKYVTSICPQFDEDKFMLLSGSMPSYDKVPKKIKKKLREITVERLVSDFIESNEGN